MVVGVMVDCWWGIVEAHAPQECNWNGYKRLFQMVWELKLKLQVTIISLIIVSCSLADSICLMWWLVMLTLDQVVMSFNECGGNFGDDVCIPLPHWVAEIGRSSYETRDSVFVSLSVAPKAAFSLQTSQITNHNFTHITCITHPFPNKTPNATPSLSSFPCRGGKCKHV